MKTILSLAAAAALALGLSGTASAATPAHEIGPQISSDANVVQAGHYWRRGSFWRGNCFYRYVYVSNGYRWRYRYVYRCY
jgi:hypothetical protein